MMRNEYAFLGEKTKFKMYKKKKERLESSILQFQKLKPKLYRVEKLHGLIPISVSRFYHFKSQLWFIWTPQGKIDYVFITLDYNVLKYFWTFLMVVLVIFFFCNFLSWFVLLRDIHYFQSFFNNVIFVFVIVRKSCGRWGFI